MSLNMQLLWGSLYLGLCLGLHCVFLGLCIEALRYSAKRMLPKSGIWRILALLMVALAIIVFSHTAQVWLWAHSVLGAEQIDGWNGAVYFSLVSYTSLGYGDIVLGPDYRVFAAFASVTGLLSFGLSTAILVALLTRFMTVENDSESTAGPDQSARP